MVMASTVTTSAGAIVVSLQARAILAVMRNVRDERRDRRRNLAVASHTGYIQS
jgi:hypothetical protein